MALLAALVVAVLVYGFGNVLVRRLGWPTDAAGAGRWGLALLVAATLATGAPDLIQHFARKSRDFPALELGNVVLVLILLGLGILGYVAWSHGRDGTGHAKDRERVLPRRRALPPPPQALDAPPGDPGFAPVAGGDADGVGEE